MPSKSPKKAVRKSKVYSISLPPDLAKRAEAIAKTESRTMSEVFREAFRAWESERILKALRTAAEYGSEHNPRGYAEEDIPRIIQDVRARVRDGRQGRLRKTG